MFAPVNEILTGLVDAVTAKEDEEVSTPLINEKLQSKVLRKQTKNTVDAELLRGVTPGAAGKVAASMWPGAIEVSVPAGWKVGEKVSAQGPHGLIGFEMPEGCQPGTNRFFTLKPVPDLLVEVPKGLKAGQSMIFEREDGAKINIVIPAGKAAGDTFEVVPPAVMVLVPEGVKAGDVVCFPMPGPPSRYWFSAVVPEELQLGKYFAARLPPPETALQVGLSKPTSPTGASETTSGPTDSDDASP